jgi:hypothetical protein
MKTGTSTPEQLELSVSKREPADWSQGQTWVPLGIPQQFLLMDSYTGVEVYQFLKA